MPVEHFKSPEAYRKWTAYRHIHGIPAPNLTTAVVAGKPHKVKHSDLSLPAMHAKAEARERRRGINDRESKREEKRDAFFGE